MLMEDSRRHGFQEVEQQTVEQKAGDEDGPEDQVGDEVLRKTGRPTTPKEAGDTAEGNKEDPGHEPAEPNWWELDWQGENRRTEEASQTEKKRSVDAGASSPELSQLGRPDFLDVSKANPAVRNAVERLDQMRTEVQQQARANLQEALTNPEAPKGGAEEASSAGTRTNSPAQKRAVMQSQIRVIEQFAVERNGLISVKEAAEAISQAGLSQQTGRAMRYIVRRRLNASPRFEKTHRGKYKLVNEQQA